MFQKMKDNKFVISMVLVGILCLIFMIRTLINVRRNKTLLAERDKLLAKKDDLLAKQNALLEQVAEGVDEDGNVLPKQPPINSSISLNMEGKKTISDLEPLMRFNLAGTHDFLLEKDKWAAKMPALNFPKAWNIKLIPPSRNKLQAFEISLKDQFVSVFLDGYGLHTERTAEPVWKVVKENRQTTEVDMSNTSGLLQAITQALTPPVTPKKRTTPKKTTLKKEA